MVGVEFYPYPLHIFDANVKVTTLVLNLAYLGRFNYHRVSLVIAFMYAIATVISTL
jgi:hypothetical protein